MKKLYIIALTLALISCSDDDCNGRASEINRRYDELIAIEMDASRVPDYDYIDHLEQQRIIELGHACDQTDVLPTPDPPQI